MIVKNMLEKTFGPFGSSTGLFMFIGGILASWYSWIGPVIALIGAFASFTTTSVLVDADNKRIKLSNDLFGFIPFGRWIDIKPEMKLGLSRSHKGYRAYIRGTQPIGIHINDIRIFLFDARDKPIMPIKKFENYSSAKKDLDNLQSTLMLDTI
jgi:hypothetical protein